ncbi:MAG: hypothetical protein WCF94_03885 [bacterium]
MKLEDIFEQEVWYVLQQVRKQGLLLGDTFYIHLAMPFEKQDGYTGISPSDDTQSKILRKLFLDKVIEIGDKGKVPPFALDKSRDIKTRIIILRPRFDEVYEKCSNLYSNINDTKIHQKQTVCINSKGIYLKQSPINKYGIRGKRFQIIKKLKTDGPVRLDDLSSYNDQEKYLASKEIKQININFKKCLKLNKTAPDLIGQSDTSGYYLDEENYIFEFSLK